MHLIRQEVLELPCLKGGIELVNITTKVKAFRIKHVLDLIFDKKHAEWKSLARYWLGIRLKAMNDVKQYIDWRGPFAETPNQFYKKCFELFKQFMKLYKQLMNPIELPQLKTKHIYDILLSAQTVIPKSFTTFKLQSHDLNFAYQVIHRVINVRSKLKKFHIITDDTCPLCHQTSETIEHLFVHCPRIQLAKHYLETILSTTIPIVINELNSLHPPGITKHQQTIIYSFIILFQNAIWKHRNEVIFQYKPVNVSTIIIILHHKIIKLLNQTTSIRRIHISCSMDQHWKPNHHCSHLNKKEFMSSFFFTYAWNYTFLHTFYHKWYHNMVRLVVSPASLGDGGHRSLHFMVYIWTTTR